MGLLGVPRARSGSGSRVHAGAGRPATFFNVRPSTCIPMPGKEGHCADVSGRG